MTLLGFRIEISSNENGSEVRFETSVLKTSEQYKASATNRISIFHSVQISYSFHSFENGEHILPNPEYAA